MPINIQYNNKQGYNPESKTMNNETYGKAKQYALSYLKSTEFGKGKDIKITDRGLMIDDHLIQLLVEKDGNLLDRLYITSFSQFEVACYNSTEWWGSDNYSEVYEEYQTMHYILNNRIQLIEALYMTLVEQYSDSITETENYITKETSRVMNYNLDGFESDNSKAFVDTNHTITIIHRDNFSL